MNDWQGSECPWPILWPPRILEKWPSWDDRTDFLGAFEEVLQKCHLMSGLGGTACCSALG